MKSQQRFATRALKLVVDLGRWQLEVARCLAQGSSALSVLFERPDASCTVSSAASPVNLEEEELIPEARAIPSFGTNEHMRMVLATVLRASERVVG